MLLSIIAGRDPGFTGFDFDFFVRIAEQAARVSQRVLGVAFQAFEGFQRLVRGITLQVFQRLEQTLDLSFHALQ
ncbi:hypothetical protein D3C86_2092730 [compost metagenome]